MRDINKNNKFGKVGCRTLSDAYNEALALRDLDKQITERVQREFSKRKNK